MTLDEFLARAGVVREDTQCIGKPNNTGLFGNLLLSGNNLPSLGVGFQEGNGNTGFMGNRIPDSGCQIAVQSAANLALNVNGVRSAQQPQQQQPPLFPKQTPLAYGTSMPIPSSGQLGSPGITGGIVRMGEPAINGSLVQSAPSHSGGMQIVGLGAGDVATATGSPAISSDGLGKSDGDTSVPPVQYMFNGGLRGRKCAAVEKVVERKQRRMIKNRESAARSRARKQAYTMELETEVAKLKDENKELRKKQKQIMEMQKNQVIALMNMQGVKKRCLRRTQTGPW